MSADIDEGESLTVYHVIKMGHGTINMPSMYRLITIATCMPPIIGQPLMF